MPTPRNRLDAERRQFARYAARESEPVYREPLAYLYGRWEVHNAEHFASQLKVPHITFGQTPPRALAYCKPLTDWGFELQITVNERLALGGHRVLSSPWPAEGTKRFLSDLVLHEMVHQHAFEVSGKQERGYRGHGRHFAEMCNTIGADLGLPPVFPRRRGVKDTGKPLCVYWPCNVRPENYYLGDVAMNHAAVGMVKMKLVHVPDWVIIFESFRDLIDQGRVHELRLILDRELRKFRKSDPIDSASTKGIDDLDLEDFR